MFTLLTMFMQNGMSVFEILIFCLKMKIKSTFSRIYLVNSDFFCIFANENEQGGVLAHLVERNEGVLISPKGSNDYYESPMLHKILTHK